MTPPGLMTLSPQKQHALTAWWTRIFSGNLVNEARFGLQTFNSETVADDQSTEEIPSLEIPELGLTGFNAAASRTGDRSRW